MSITGALAWVILALPFAALALTVWWVGRDRSRRHLKGEQTDHYAVEVADGSRDEGAPDPVVAPLTAQPVGDASAAKKVDAANNTLHADGQLGSAPLEAQHDDELKAAPELFPSPSEKTRQRRQQGTSRTTDLADLGSEAKELDASVLDAQIAEAISAKNDVALAQCYLRRGVVAKDQGHGAQAKDWVRRSLLLAMKMKDKRLQALGRFELGDLMMRDGDTSSACEHWQMAKAIFTELRQETDRSAVEQRMLTNGCPTDWVLTEF